MQRQRKFNAPSGPPAANGNMIVPIKPFAPWFFRGVEVTPENAADLFAAHREGEQAGYRWRELERIQLDTERRRRLEAWLASGRTLFDWYDTMP